MRRSLNDEARDRGSVQRGRRSFQKLLARSVIRGKSPSWYGSEPPTHQKYAAEKPVNLQRHSMVVNQSFQNGYVYLDRCGAFLVAAARDFGFIPGEVRPTGAELTHPELGIRAVVSAQWVELRLEPAATGLQEFEALAIRFSKFALAFFEIDLIDRISAVEQWLFPCTTVEQALNFTLSFPVDEGSVLQKAMGMVIGEKSFYTWMRSGSRLLQLKANAVTFESVMKTKKTAPMYSSKSHAAKIARMNQQSLPVEHPYGVILETTVIEEAPAADVSLADHFELCHKKAETFRSELLK